MYDTAKRVALVKQRVRENTRRRQRREAISLSAACMLLFAVLTQAAGIVVGPGQPEAWGAFGAMLLREDAGGYVLVAVVSFAAAPPDNFANDMPVLPLLHIPVCADTPPNKDLRMPLYQSFPDHNVSHQLQTTDYPIGKSSAKKLR